MSGASLLRVAGLVGALVTAQAQAVPLTDTYIGGNDHGYGDIIGSADWFDIQRAEVTRDNGLLRVDIFTNFVGHVGVYPSLTQNNKGIGYGDLLLGGPWTPFVKPGDNSAANVDGHKFDNASNGTQWRYGLSFDDPWSQATSGSFTLYQLNGTNVENLILTEELFKSNAIVRDGQAVQVDRAAQTVAARGTGSWSIDTVEKRLSFVLDLSQAPTLANWDYLSLHWGMTCNNDAIEGGVELPSVPEPASLALFSLGLAGALTPLRRRRRAA
ncbi:MAG: PEP-CTERM sorting domain-containing protein [Gammaproteobacteria bacterium]